MAKMEKYMMSHKELRILRSFLWAAMIIIDSALVAEGQVVSDQASMGREGSGHIYKPTIIRLLKSSPSEPTKEAKSEK